MNNEQILSAIKDGTILTASKEDRIRAINFANEKLASGKATTDKVAEFNKFYKGAIKSIEQSFIDEKDDEQLSFTFDGFETNFEFKDKSKYVILDKSSVITSLLELGRTDLLSVSTDFNKNYEAILSSLPDGEIKSRFESAVSKEITTSIKINRKEVQENEV